MTNMLEVGEISSTAEMLPIVETFHSVQGEGAWAGTNAFFIRLALCDVGCPWCDTKISWSDKRHPRRTIEDLANGAAACHPRFVVITGGEPLMHDLNPLTQALRAKGLRIHLETSGSHPLSGEFDWITLSPKIFKPPLPGIYPLVNELKLVVANTTDFQWAEQQSALTTELADRYLQPEWGSHASQQQIFDYILQHPQWRMSLQTHKLLGVR
ncbi:7-carboxy-7-deazaguanine synthase QueE [filamentous cyanobacterium LEGE 11480]|uniref:7-carboxy-7-deazaguanine synthase n=1 Tax=Romeriopsis navalis LEGE 11480 TaxID=2777977 RepID=A0A928VKZ6_9CYAN|nr:7-carboxy-7-deazaguanine synthase QueE [Romeriopsis navalis]MBE9029562.1 7-carboxy-7-deazaguanine synthase QueE [Romeriopsis navalis LEGE 11480]